MVREPGRRCRDEIWVPVILPAFVPGKAHSLRVESLVPPYEGSLSLFVRCHIRRVGTPFQINERTQSVLCEYLRRRATTMMEVKQWLDTIPCELRHLGER